MGIRGLFVGINQYSERPLRGCVNDVTGVRDLLQSQYGLPSEQTRLLTDGEATRAAIIDGLRWLAQPDADDGPAVRVFHYAGHGLQHADDNGDEPDGSDECIQPFDYATAGVLNDDTLAELYGGFLGGTRLLLLMDCCHSGTISKDIFSDKRYRTLPLTPEEKTRIEAARHEFQRGQVGQIVGMLEEVRSRAASPEELGKAAAQIIATVQKQSFGKPQSHENVVLLAACKPEQLAADAKFGDSYHGAMTFFLSQALRNAPGITYEALAAQLRRQLYDNKFDQVPQLECDLTHLDKPFMT